MGGWPSVFHVSSALLFTSYVAMAAADVAAEHAKRGSFDLLKSLIFSGEDPANIQGRSPVPMRVIGAGLSRTGTSSLVEALHQLGYNPYHMVEGVLDHGHTLQWARWVKAWEAGDNKELQLATNVTIDLMAANGFDATTDFPAFQIFEELMLRYPDAKVILSTRSSQSWANSFLESVWPLIPLMSSRPFTFLPKIRAVGTMFRAFLPMIGAKMDPVTFQTDEESLVAAFDAWDERVRKAVPAARLLVHTSSEGFAPICEFLGINDCPDEYPNINDKKQMQQFVILLQVITWVWLPVALVSIGVMLYCIRCCCCVGSRKAKDE